MLLVIYLHWTVYCIPSSKEGTQVVLHPSAIPIHSFRDLTQSLPPITVPNLQRLLPFTVWLNAINQPLFALSQFLRWVFFPVTISVPLRSTYSLRVLSINICLDGPLLLYIRQTIEDLVILSQSLFQPVFVLRLTTLSSHTLVLTTLIWSTELWG